MVCVKDHPIFLTDRIIEKGRGGTETHHKNTLFLLKERKMCTTRANDGREEVK